MSVVSLEICLRTVFRPAIDQLPCQRPYTDLILTMLDTFHQTSYQMPVVSFLLKTLRQFYQLTPADPIPLVDWQSLQDLEADSLGQALILHLDQHQLQPFTQGPRRVQLHDTVHVLTGYGVDLLGEIEVQAFLFGCKSRPFHILLGMGLLTKLLWSHGLQSDHRRIWYRIQAAYQRGQQSSFHPDCWSPQEQWHQPLEQVRGNLALLSPDP